MNTLTVPAKFKHMTESDYDDYLGFLAANCCELCNEVADLSRAHDTNGVVWACAECNAEIDAAELAAAELEAAEISAAAGRALLQVDGCQNCGASGRTFEMGETAADSWRVCEVCAEDYRPAPAIEPAGRLDIAA